MKTSLKSIKNILLQGNVINIFCFVEGYDNQDWFIPSPALEVDEADLKLSPDQIRETLNYFRKYLIFR